MEDLRDLLVHEIQDLYDAENQLVEALPKLAKKAQHPDLKAAFEAHLGETKEHVERLKQVAKLLRTTTGSLDCKGMKGLIKEGDEIIKEGKDPDVIDAGLIGAAQKAEHYEIASYGTAIAHAKKLGHKDVAAILQKTIEEEGAADKKLTQIALAGVNAEAA